MNNSQDDEVRIGSAGRPISVLLVEDHKLLAEALQTALAGDSEIEVHAIASTIAEAKLLLRRRRYDVALVDLQLPDGDGLTAAGYILQEYPNIRVIIVTARTERNLISKALNMGCSGYVSKDESFAHVANSIHAAQKGSTVLSPLIASALAQSPTKIYTTAISGPLTPREREVLGFLAQGFNAAEIGERIFLSSNTVRNHISNINEKLGTHSKLEAVSKAIREGLIEAPLKESEQPGGIVPVNDE